MAKDENGTDWSLVLAACAMLGSVVVPLCIAWIKEWFKLPNNKAQAFLTNIQQFEKNVVSQGLVIDQLREQNGELKGEVDELRDLIDQFKVKLDEHQGVIDQQAKQIETYSKALADAKVEAETHRQDAATWKSMHDREKARADKLQQQMAALGEKPDQE